MRGVDFYQRNSEISGPYRKSPPNKAFFDYSSPKIFLKSELEKREKKKSYCRVDSRLLKNTRFRFENAKSGGISHLSISQNTQNEMMLGLDDKFRMKSNSKKKVDNFSSFYVRKNIHFFQGRACC